MSHSLNLTILLSASPQSIWWHAPGSANLFHQLLSLSIMSRSLRELYVLLGIKLIGTSVFHPQTDGLVERFNRTLKTMIRKFIFAVREVPQASMGFSPLELLYGHQPRGVLDVIRETWEDRLSQSNNEIQSVMDLRTKLHTLGWLSMENLLQDQNKQSWLYNRGTNLHKFALGDKVPVLLPTSSSKLLAKWQSGSFLDLTKGYWQILLSPLSREKTAFTTTFGLHQFVTLPSGLFGAPATFQRLMNRLLRPHGAYAAAYLDDIIILRREVRQFLGLARYYRRFVPNYSSPAP